MKNLSEEGLELRTEVNGDIRSVLYCARVGLLSVALFACVSPLFRHGGCDTGKLNDSGFAFSGRRVENIPLGA